MISMVEKGILFNGDMVRAILEGRKTQTRRAINAPAFKQVRDPNKIYWKNDQVIFQWHGDTIGEIAIKPPYQPGDILWVRETWAKRIHSDNRYYYKADNNLGAVFNRENDKWRPSIHMPREAARLFLRVVNVRAERLQDITENDAKAEGCDANIPDGMPSAVAWFHQVWERLNVKRGFGWNTNPWVWAIQFEVIEDASD